MNNLSLPVEFQSATLKALIYANRPGWTRERASLLARACQAAARAHSRGEPITQWLASKARRMAKRQYYTTEPSKRFQISRATLERVYGTIRAGRAETVLVLKYSNPRSKTSPDPIQILRYAQFPGHTSFNRLLTAMSKRTGHARWTWSRNQSWRALSPSQRRLLSDLFKARRSLIALERAFTKAINPRAKNGSSRLK